MYNSDSPFLPFHGLETISGVWLHVSMHELIEIVFPATGLYNAFSIQLQKEFPDSQAQGSLLGQFQAPGKGNVCRRLFPILLFVILWCLQRAIDCESLLTQRL